MPEQPLDFRPTPRLRRLAGIAVAAILAAVVTARGDLAILAAAPLVVLAVSPRRGLPRRGVVTARLDPARCVEDDEVTVTVSADVPGAERVEVVLAAPGHTDLLRGEVRRDGHRSLATWTLVPRRWGRYRTGPARVRVVGGNGLYDAELALSPGQLVVYPGGGAAARAVAPRQLPAWFGEHPSRTSGSGAEFAGLRPYAAGDRRRDIDWRASARHQELVVREYAAERSFALVLVLDVGVDAGEPGRSTLDLTVRAATGLAHTYLAAHDRVGLVALGGWVRWLPPATGFRQLHRIAESVMAVRLDDERVDAGIDRLPPPVLPPGASVCVLSPLLDARAPEAVRDLRGRGHPVVVVDVLTTEPEVPRRSHHGPLALRVWRMEREATRAELAALGVVVVDWDGTDDLSGRLLHAWRALRPEVRA